MVQERVPGGRTISSETFLCLELTDHCDLKCRMCDQALRKLPHHSKGKGFMEPALWRRILDRLVENGVHLHGISPIWVGESLLHPRFAELVRYAFDRNPGNRLFDFFSVNTSATALGPDAAEAILDCANRPDIQPSTFWGITFSIDAASRETFRAIKGHDRLEEVEANIRSFIRRQKERGARFPLPILKLIVMPENRHEVAAFHDRWVRFLTDEGIAYQVNYDYLPHMVRPTIFFDKFIGADPEQDEKLHREAAVELGLVEPARAAGGERIIASDEAVRPGAVRRPCPAIWKTPMVAHDGEMAPCCHDSGLSLALGNLASDDFVRLWTGGRVDDLRVRHVRGEFDYPPCRWCPNQRHPMVTDAEIVAYLEEIGRRDLVRPYCLRVGRDPDAPPRPAAR